MAKIQQSRPQVSQQQAKQSEKPAPAKPITLPSSDDFDEDNEDEADAEFYEDTEKVEEKPKVDEKTLNKVEMEMELLQNNGRFRAELLFQLQEINRALVVIAQVLAK